MSLNWRLIDRRTGRVDLGQWHTRVNTGFSVGVHDEVRFDGSVCNAPLLGESQDHGFLQAECAGCGQIFALPINKRLRRPSEDEPEAVAV